MIDFNSPRSDNLDDLSGKSPSTGKRVVEISDLVKQRRGRAVWLRFGSGSKISFTSLGFQSVVKLIEPRTACEEFREDPQEHSAMFNVIGPNPWNLGGASESLRYHRFCYRF